MARFIPDDQNHQRHNTMIVAWPDGPGIEDQIRDGDFDVRKPPADWQVKIGRTRNCNAVWIDVADGKVTVGCGLVSGLSEDGEQFTKVRPITRPRTEVPTCMISGRSISRRSRSSGWGGWTGPRWTMPRVF